MARVQERKYGHIRTYIRAGSRTPTRAYVRPGLVYMERQRRRHVHRQPTGWVRTEKLRRRVHREATECMLFIGSQPAWTEQPTETRPGVPQNGGNGLVFSRPCSRRDHVHREGSGVPQNGGNGPPTIEMGVLLIGRGVAYRKTDETDLLRSKRGSY